MYTVVFTRPASAELIEAQDGYEGEAVGLGRRFRQEIDMLVERVSANPLAISDRVQERAPRSLTPLSILVILCP